MKKRILFLTNFFVGSFLTAMQQEPKQITVIDNGSFFSDIKPETPDQKAVLTKYNEWRHKLWQGSHSLHEIETNSITCFIQLLATAIPFDDSQKQQLQQQLRTIFCKEFIQIQKEHDH